MVLVELDMKYIWDPSLALASSVRIQAPDTHLGYSMAGRVCNCWVGVIHSPCPTPTVGPCVPCRHHLPKWLVVPFSAPPFGRGRGAMQPGFAFAHLHTPWLQHVKVVAVWGQWPGHSPPPIPTHPMIQHTSS